MKNVRQFFDGDAQPTDVTRVRTNHGTIFELVTIPGKHQTSWHRISQPMPSWHRSHRCPGVSWEFLTLCCGPITELIEKPTAAELMGPADVPSADLAQVA